MMAAGKARWPNQFLVIALLACCTLVTAGSCGGTTISNVNGDCNPQGGSNKACNTAVDPSSAAGLAPSSHRPSPSGLTTVSVAAGSEDMAFFEDPQVRTRFAARGISVDVTPFGSGQLAKTLNPGGYDAFFLSSQVFADMAESRLGAHAEYHPFSTPLRVFTWARLVPLLRTIGVVNDAGQFDIRKYLDAAGSGTTWDHIPGNTFYPNPSQVLLEMTDPEKSDSGAMFVAAAGQVIYVQIQHKQMVYGESWVTAVAPAIKNVVDRLGEMPPTTNVVYTDYRRGGMNGVPLALGYESEWEGVQPPQFGRLPADAVSLPLDSPVDCGHVVFAFSQNGKTFGSLLETDPILQGQARKYGFETTAPDAGFPITVPDVHFLRELIDDVVPH
jgi:hypothetical protein